MPLGLRWIDRKHGRQHGGGGDVSYLPNERPPREVDDKTTLSLGHELLHCMLGDYHG
jgi:hypothetical protein